jgi:hypothetical protein
MHENREASKASVDQADRSAKAQSRTADVYAMEESDCRVVPVKQPNKEGRPSAEAVEGRRQPKENDAQSNIQPTQSGQRVSQGLSGVRRVFRRSYPREEPYAVIPQVRICAGGDQRWSSLPQTATKTAISDRSSSRSASRKVANPYSRDSLCSAFLPEAKIPDANLSDVAVRHTSYYNQETPIELCALMLSLKDPISG